jgi:hypothetical protein
LYTCSGSTVPIDPVSNLPARPLSWQPEFFRNGDCDDKTFGSATDAS